MVGDSWDAEVARVNAVHELALLDTPPEERFDRITRLAADLLGTPVAFLSLMDLDRQFLKSRLGVPFDQTPRQESLCTHTLRLGALLEIPDTTADPRYATVPAVTGPPHLRFYAGQPLRDHGSRLLGTLCVGDQQPRAIDDGQRARLADLARWAELELVAARTDRFAERARKARVDFVSVVSNELRAPLAATHDALEQTRSADPQVRVAAKNTDQLLRLTDDVLVYANLHNGALQLRLAETELQDVVGDAVAAVASAAELAEVTLVADPPSVSLRCDRDRLVQAFTNLLANAVRVASAGSEVLVGGFVDQDRVLVDVCVAGPGLPQAHLDRVFEPFARLNGSSAGLGLAITKGIVAAHHGSVRAGPNPAAATRSPSRCRSSAPTPTAHGGEPHQA